jgi:hypothetical protein
LLGAWAVLHDQNRNCRVSTEILLNLAPQHEKKATSYSKINAININQGELNTKASPI